MKRKESPVLGLEKLKENGVAMSEQPSADYPDTEGLGFVTFPGRGVIGFVGHVNGDGAQACPDYTPTRYELTELAKHWLRQVIEIDFLWFNYQSTGSSEWRVTKYSNRRLDRLEACLGNDVVAKAEREVMNEFREKYGEELWDAFERGEHEA